MIGMEKIIAAVVSGFTYDPGHSDLDDEQPINVRMTLGDWRKARLLSAQPEKRDSAQLCTRSFRHEGPCNGFPRTACFINSPVGRASYLGERRNERF